jgi:hypothetical protein
VCSLVDLGVRAWFPNPFTSVGQATPIVIGVVVSLVASLVGLTRRAGPDLVALASAAWVTLMGASQTHGTPYPYGGMEADIARLTALADRFTTHIGSADLLIKGLPSEYPPLFPWIVGRASAVTGVPAWRLMGPASVVACGVAVAAAYVLWRRIVPPRTAAAIALIAAAVFGEPRKPHEVVAVSVVAPWIIGSFARLGGEATPRLHWLAGGVVGGLLVADYQGYLAFAALGLVAVVVMSVLTPDRRAYMRHLVLLAVTAAVVSSWFLGPWLTTLVEHGSENIDDKFPPSSTAPDYWHPPWAHAWPVALLLLAGVVVLVLGVRRFTWAPALLAVTASAMVYRWLMAYRFQHTGHTGFYQYTGRLSDGTLAVAAVLGAAEIWPTLRLKMPSAGRRSFAVLAMAGVLSASMAVYWDAQRLGHAEGPGRPNFARLAQATPLLNGRYPSLAQYAAPLRAVFPYASVHAIVSRRLGDDALPVVLTSNEALSSYYPYYQYLGNGAYSSNTLSHWIQRLVDVEGLSQLTDSASFAQRCEHMRYGVIDVFVLTQRHGRLNWGHDVTFDEAQFGAGYFYRDRASATTWVFTRINAAPERAHYPT